MYRVAPPGSRARLASLLSGYRVDDLSVAGLQEVLQRLTAHRRVNVQVGDAGDGGELLQHEEDRAVVDQAPPVAAADEVTLLIGQVRLGERGLLIGEEPGAVRGLAHRVQVLVEPVAL